jgi:Flp pilus assembly protein CpaB
MAVREQLRRRWRPVRRTVLSRRRSIAAVLAALSVVAALHELRPPPPDVRPVPTVVRDLPAGTTLTARDVVTVDYARGTAPSGLASDPVGRVLAGPMRAGEAITDLRLVGAPLAAAYADDVALPVRLPDAGMAGLLRVGDRIDLVAADPQGDEARLVASDVTVVALPASDDEEVSGALPGRLVVVAAPPEVRDGLVQAAVTGFLTFAYSR